MENTDRELRVGVIGCGVIARTHLPYIRKAGGRVVGLADASHAAANDLADRFGIQRIYRGIDELLDVERPDVVHILTPPHTHCEVAVAALSRGVHALVEKPMAVTPTEAQEMASVAAESRALLTCDHNRLFDPPMLEARRLFDSGALGRIVHVESYQAGMAGERDWLKRLEGAGLGDLLPHPLYLQLAFMGRVSEVDAFAVKSRATGDYDELRVGLRGEGCTGTLTISMNAKPHLNTLKLCGTRMTIEVNLNNMTIVKRRDYALPKIIAKSMPNLHEAEQLVLQTVRNTVNFVTGRARYYPGMGELIRRFYEAVRGKGESPVPVDRAAQVVKVTSAIWECVGIERPDGRSHIRAVK